MSATVVTVNTLYCGGWGYKRRSERLRKDLLAAFVGHNVLYTGEASKGITGEFEVTVNGTLVHSKKGGDGFVDSDKKLKKIVEAIKAALK